MFLRISALRRYALLIQSFFLKTFLVTILAWNYDIVYIDFVETGERAIHLLQDAADKFETRLLDFRSLRNHLRAIINIIAFNELEIAFIYVALIWYVICIKNFLATKNFEKLIAPEAERLRRLSMLTAEHKIKDGNCMVTLAMNDGKGEVMRLKILSSGEEQAQRIEKNFKSNAEDIYCKLIELLDK